MPKKVKFFLKRSSKVQIQGKNPIIIPFQIVTVILLIILIFLSAFLFIRSDLFQIKAIDLVSQIPDCVSEDGIRFQTEAVGQSIFFYDIEAAKNRILDKFYCLENVELIKSYPSTLKVSVFERKTVLAALQINAEPTLEAATSSASLIPPTFATQSALFALDKEGFLFKNLSTSSATPKVGIAQNLIIPGKITQGEILWLGKFQETAINFNLNFIEFIKTQDGTIVGKMREGFLILLSAKTDEKKIVSSLQAILRQAKIEGVKFKILDLRFEKPILR